MYCEDENYIKESPFKKVILLLDLGIRNSELCNIKLTDIYEDSIRIFGKGKKIRCVPLAPVIHKALVRFLRARESFAQDKYNYDFEYLLLSQKGKKLTPETVENKIDCPKSQI